MQNPDSPLRLLRLPSLDGEAYELVAALPPGMSVAEGLSLANQIILEANREDQVNEGACDNGLPVETNIKNRLQANGFVFPEVGVTQCWDEYVEASPVATIVTQAPEEGEQVWRATMYLAGQLVLGEWLGLAYSPAEACTSVMRLHLTSSLETGEEPPSIRLEQPGQGLSGPFHVLAEGKRYDSALDTVKAFKLAVLLRETTGKRITVEFEGEELFELGAIEQDKLP